MTAINVTQMWSKEGGSGESEKYDSFAQKFSHTEGYQVLAQIGDSAEDVLSATGVPAYGQKHRSGVESFVRSKSAAPMGPIFWIVTVNYEGKFWDSTVDVEWTDSTSSEPIDRDFNGVAIVTSVGEQIEGLTMDLSDDVVIIRRKFFLINKVLYAPYRHATNSDTFLGWPPGTARLIGYSAKNQFKFGAPLEQWDVTARIQFRIPYMGATAAQAWYRRWRHEGLWVSDGASGYYRARDQNKQETTKPVLLKANGTQEFNPNNALFNYTQVYGSLPYSALGLV